MCANDHCGRELMQSRIAPSGSSRPGAHVFRTIAGLCIALSLLAAVAPALAAVAYVGSSASSLGSSGTSSVTMTAPSGLVSGNVMVAWVAQNTSGLPAVTAAPSGWTQVLEQNDGNSIGTAVYYRVATSADVAGTTNYTWSFQQSARSGGLIVAFSGVSTTSPVVASASQANGASGSYTAPSITPGVANTMLLALFAADSGNVTMATPAGTTSAFAGSTGAGPNGIAIGAFYETLSASTATGQVQSSGNTSATNVGATLALQSAAGGGGGGSASGFNAVDGYLSSYPASTAAQRIYTKLAGTGFTLNVAALNSATPTPGLLSPAYVSGTNKVTVDLVDDSDGSCAASCAGSTCQAKAALTTLTTSFVNGDSSYKKGLSFTLANAYPNVRVRVKDTSNSPTVYGCSVDNFSVRPTSLTVTSSANADPSGASATATPVVKAGATFALTATAVAGYSGTPSVNGSAVTVNPLSPGVASGSFGAANASNGVAAGNFAYSEAGYFTLNTDAVHDQSFTSVDQAGDCTADYSNTLVNGKYGCYFGNSATTAFGRFVPDHFAIAAGSVTPACGSFTYFDQDGFVTTFTLTAQNSSNATTLNYTGSFARLVLTSWAGYGFTGDSATPSASATAPTGSWSNGVASISARHQVLIRPTTTPAAPASLTVSARPVDPDGITTATAAAVMSAGTPIRFGVLALGSAYGSALLPLRVPLTAMVWNGTALVANTADTCTGAVLSNAGIALGNQVQKPGTTGSFSTSVPASPTLASTWSQGTGSITLAAPGTAGTAQIALNLGSGSADASCIGWSVASTGSHLPWLRGNWCSSGYASDPSSLASFGTGATPFVYFRENH
jgi:hypothetical protein